MLGITWAQPGRTQVDIEADINHLRLGYLQSSLHQYMPGHTQSTISLDGFTQGEEKIRKVLPTFLQKFGI